MDLRDIALQSTTPVVVVPRFSQFETLDHPGHRFLVAKDGMWLEARRPWLYLRLPIARQVAVPMPYGDVERTIKLAFGRVPADTVHEFIRHARSISPEECAAWIVWDELKNMFSLRHLEPISCDTEHVHFHRPVLAEHEHLVVDMHSHGAARAFFSPKDDRDDRGEFKISGVIGNLGTSQVTAKFRLCANGLHIPLPLPWLVQKGVLE